MAHWRGDPRLAYAQIFKNSGAAAGRVAGARSQPDDRDAGRADSIENELNRAEDYFRPRRCVFCEMIDRELAERTRMVAETERFVAFCPFASQFPYETWILPRQHSSHFEFTEDGGLVELAGHDAKSCQSYGTSLERSGF
jgi:UDPglucose--hexose-1-phosphate uridylyltransferase